MQHSRVRFIVEMDLDFMPGWGNDPNDFGALLKRQLDGSIPHYNPTVEYAGFANEAPAFMKQIRDLTNEILNIDSDE